LPLREGRAYFGEEKKEVIRWDENSLKDGSKTIQQGRRWEKSAGDSFQGRENQ